MKLKTFILLLLVCCFTYACKNTTYPCPGSGQYKETDLSLFDEDGKPLSKNKRKKYTKKNENGLINKAQPSKLQRKR